MGPAGRGGNRVGVAHTRLRAIVTKGGIRGFYLRPTASMGSRSSLMSCWMEGPIARASMLMQVKTVASTCTDFCLLQRRIRAMILPK